VIRGRSGGGPGEKIVNERYFGCVAQCARVAPCHDAFRGFVQNDAAVGHQENAGQFVGHNDYGDAQVAAERQDELIEFDCRDRVETGGRLVEKEEIGLEYQGARNAGTLFHAARYFARQMLGKRAQPDKVKLGLHKLPRDGAPNWGPRRQRKRKVLCECHRAEECARLEEYPEGWNALVAVWLAHAVDFDYPGFRLFKANQISQQRALAAARSAEDREDRSSVDLERDALYDHSGSPSDAQVLDADVRRGW